MSVADLKNRINQLSIILSPENLDSTKAYTLFNGNLEANIADLLTITEISKIEPDIFKLNELLINISFLTVDVDVIRLSIHEDLNVFSIVNLPHSFNTKSLYELIPLLKEKETSVRRIYKKSLFWIIVTESKEFSLELSSVLNNLEFNESEMKVKVKFDHQSSDQIKTQLLKLLNHNHKESNGVKKEHNDYTSVNSSQKLSWRKKSNDTNEPNNFMKKDNYKGKDSCQFNRSSNANPPTNIVRDRYNSDGQKLSAFKPVKRYDEIEIDLSKINYSLKIKHKYSNGDLLLYYDKFRINKVFESMPKFDNLIEEICSKEKRKEFNFLKRERSLTFSVPLAYKNSTKKDEVKLNLDAPSFKLPEKNPLSGGKLSGIKLNK